jgi:hypothetical protein
MDDSQSGCPTQEPLSRNVPKKEGVAEDKIDLLDYLVVLWKRKNLVLLGSILPALLVGGILFLSPRDYKVTYAYDVSNRPGDSSGTDATSRSKYLFTADAVEHSRYPFTTDVAERSRYAVHAFTTDVSNWNLDERSYSVLQNLFYSKENLDRLADTLQKEGATEYAKLMSGARRRPEQEGLVEFEALPSYIDLSKVKEPDPTVLRRIRKLNAQLLNMTITARPKDKLPGICAVIRRNLEDELSVRLVAKQLGVAMRRIRAQMARIEGEKFALQLDLAKNKSVLEKFKHIEFGTASRAGSGVVLQFDLGTRSEFLPIEHQIQTAEMKIIELGETIKNNEKEYEYYRDLLGLDEKFFAVLGNGAVSGYTLRKFHSFLVEFAKQVEKQELRDYLGSYIKSIENRMAASIPVTEQPSVYVVSNNTVQKSAIVFAACLIISMFAAFLLEGLQRIRVETASKLNQ